MRLRLLTICFFIMAILSSVCVNANEADREFATINAANGLADNSAEVIVCTKTGRMIISTIGNLNFYDGATFTHIITNHEYQYQLSDYKGKNRLYFDHYHHLWLKNNHSVTCIDLKMELFIPNVEGVFRELGCESNVLDLFTDNSGDVWLLTDKSLYDVEHKQTFQILRDRNLQELDVRGDTLLTFYDNGEELGIDIKSGQIKHRTKAYDWDDAQQYTKSSNILRYNNSYFLIRNGETGSVLLQFDINTLRWSTLLKVSHQLNSMAILNNKLYIAASVGYWVHDMESGEQNHIETIRLKGGKMLEPNCNTVMFDKQGGLWLGTVKRGVLYSSPSTSPFHVYSLDEPIARSYVDMMENLAQNISEFNGRAANCMYTDSRNWSWFGTTTGLYLYKTPKSEPIIFNKNNGLINEVIHSIVEDKHHNIWVSTSWGISCVLFEGENPIFVNSFNDYDNVPNESFINCKAMCLDDGRIIMQSIDHVVEFDPEGFKLTNIRRPVTLYPKMIRLMVNGNYVEPGESLDGITVINNAITRAHDINLTAEQSSVTMTFSGLNYFRPIQTCYRVRIKGIDDDWKVYSYFNGTKLVDVKGMLNLPLVGLKPGDYTIEVQASMFPDSWDGTIPYEWVIHVNQPWWQATGVYMLIVLTIIVLMVLNFLLFGKNTRMRARRNTEEGDIIRKIRSFVDRCEAFGNEMLAPTEDDLYSKKRDPNSRLTPDFLALMMTLIPYVREHKDGFTMRELAEAGNVDIVKLYDVMTANLYKSPRELARLFRLQKAAEMLLGTEKTVEQIGQECGFYTPNYFMGCFFHQYKLTPAEYRDEQKETL